MGKVVTEVKIKSDNEMAGEKVYQLAGMYHDILMATERLEFLYQVGYNHLLDNLGVNESGRSLLYGYFHDLEALKNDFVRLRDQHDVATNFLKLWWMENIEDKEKSCSGEN